MKGGGNSFDFGGRALYDRRLARFISNDPDENKYPWQTTFTYSGNSSIYLKDKDGKGYVVTIYSPLVSSVLRKLDVKDLSKENFMSVLGKIKAEFSEGKEID